MTGKVIASVALAGSGLPPALNELLVEGVFTAFAHLQKKRLEESRRILVRQIAKGKTWKLTDDENAAAILTYLRAAQEGVANINLEAMAEAIVSENLEPVLTAHTRRRHLTNLASLSLEEVYVLAAFIRAKSDFDAHPNEDAKKFFPWPQILEKLTIKQPIFEDEVDVIAVCSALQRTGYIRPISVYSGTAFGITKQLIELSLIVNLEDAQRRA